MGYPSEEDTDFINNEFTLNYLRKLPKHKSPVKWEEKIPHANPQAIDLLLKMLRFSPDHRITVQEAIVHPYFASYQHLGAPPSSDAVFNWSWDYFDLNKELL